MRETLVLLPGMMCDERMFDAQLRAFRDTHEVDVVPLTGADSIEGLASSILGSIGAAKFNLAGLSMGGIVAMSMAGLSPERVSRLALLDTNHRADGLERIAVRNRQIADVRAGRLSEVIVEEMKPLYLAAANRDNRALLDLLVKMAMDLGSDVFVTQSIALRDRSDQTHALRNYPGSTLVMCGAEDLLCPPSRHHEIASLMKRSSLVEIPDAGHISTLENPDAVILAMWKWLAQPISFEEL